VLVNVPQDIFIALNAISGGQRRGLEVTRRIVIDSHHSAITNDSNASQWDCWGAPAPMSRKEAAAKAMEAYEAGDSATCSDYIRTP
jgi:hypothetical protein